MSCLFYLRSSFRSSFEILDLDNKITNQTWFEKKTHEKLVFTKSNIDQVISSQNYCTLLRTNICYKVVLEKKFPLMIVIYKPHFFKLFQVPFC